MLFVKNQQSPPIVISFKLPLLFGKMKPPSNKIVILICYFGKFPWFFQYFLYSCSYNKEIDFLIFTDNPKEDQAPGNVKFIYTTIEDIKIRASEKLGFKVNIDFPYKLCDFKPAYGLIFSEYIKQYTFWGQSDIDIIYGDIRYFMTDDFLNKYDYISMRHDYTTGCFALYRNNTFINNIFKRSRDYQMIFSDSKHFCFDECNFAWDLLTAGKSIDEVDTEIESFTHIIKHAQQTNELRAHFDFLLIEGAPGKITFDKGKIFFKKNLEGIMYHLYWLKRNYFPKNPVQLYRKHFISAHPKYILQKKPAMRLNKNTACPICFE